MNYLKVSAILRTTDYRGDHNADVCVAYCVADGETVQSLVSRLLFCGKDPLYKDVIELRIACED